MAAEAGGQQLPAQRLAQILSSGGKGVRVNRETADFVANIWVDYALLGQAVAQGKLPMDSASVAEAVWPEISELKGTHWHDTLMAHRASVSDAAVDSLYQAPDTCGCSSTSCSAPAPTAGADAATAVKKKAEADAGPDPEGRQVRPARRELSEDPGSKADSGFLPPSPKGRFVPAFDSVGWALAAGAGERRWSRRHSAITSSSGPRWPRPAAASVDYLQERAGAQLDSLYMDSLAAANKIEVLSGAPAAMRAAAEAPDESTELDQGAGDVTPAAQLTVKDYLRWVRALPPQYTAQLKSANDSDADQVRPDPDAERAAAARGRSQQDRDHAARVGTLKRRTRASSTRSGWRWGCRTADLTDSSVAASPSARRWRGLKVERYFDQLIAGKTRLRPLPSGAGHAAARAAAVRASTTPASTARSSWRRKSRPRPTRAAPKGAMQRAPGGPPIPGCPAAAASARRERPRPRRRAAAGAERRSHAGPAAEKPAGTSRAHRRARVCLDAGDPASAGVRLAAQDTTALRPPPVAPAAPGADSHRRRPAAARRRSPAARRRPPGTMPDTAVVVDRVVAVVGNRPVLASQVDEEIFSRQSQGQQLPDRPRLARRRSASRSSRRSWTRSCWSSRRSATPPSR